MTSAFDISIVISSYNREDKVLKTIESLVESDLSAFEHVELIIIDDGSPKPVGELLPAIRQIPGNIMLRLIRQENSGIGATRNRGFREAGSGKIIFLDDDIILRRTTIKDMYDANRDNQGPVIFGTYPFLSYSSVSLQWFAENFFGYDKLVTEKKIERTDGITSGLLFVDKEKLNGLQEFYKDDLTIPAAEEHEIIFRFYKAGIPVFYARHIAAIHNHHLQLSWLAQQQYKYGMATAEAFRKNPEILEMEKFAIWKRSFDSLGSGVGKRMFRNVLASRIGRKIIFFYAGFVEKISPRGHHDFIFGLVASAYFRAGYRKGEKKFASKL